MSKLNPAGADLVYSTYLGGAGVNYGTALAVDSAGNAYVTGQTSANPFTGATASTTNPIQASLGGSNATNAYVAELNASGSELVYWTYLGGSGSDYGNAIAVDSSGNVYVNRTCQLCQFPHRQPASGRLGGLWRHQRLRREDRPIKLHRHRLGTWGADLR